MTDRRRHEPEGEPMGCGHPTACLVYGGSEPTCGWCLAVDSASRDRYLTVKHQSNELARLRSELEESSRMLAAKDDLNRELNRELEALRAENERLRNEWLLVPNPFDASFRGPEDIWRGRSRVNTSSYPTLRRPEPRPGESPKKDPWQVAPNRALRPVFIVEEGGEQARAYSWHNGDLVSACPTRAAAEAARRLMEMKSPSITTEGR